MPLQKFRDRQKLIYWGIAIVVIPSFVLLGFSGFLSKNPASQPIGSFFGKKISQAQYEQFRIRLRGLYRGMPSYFGFINPTDGQFRPVVNEEVTAFLLMALAEDAARRGIVVTDDEVATFIRAQINYTGNDNREFRTRINRELSSRQIPLDNSFSYQLAVKENLMARKALAFIDNAAVVPAPAAEIQDAQEKTGYSFKQATVSVLSQKPDAEKTIDALPTEELTARIEKFISDKQAASDQQNYPFLWNAARWKIDYIFAPQETGRVINISDEKISEYYSANREQYKKPVDPKKPEPAASGSAEQHADEAAQHLDEEYLPLAEARESIAQELRKRELIGAMNNTLGREFSDFVWRHNQQSANPTSIAVAEINADPRLQELRLTAGSTGENSLTAEEIFDEKSNDENLRGVVMARFYLNNLERQIQQAAVGNKDNPEKAVADFLLPYQRDFHGYAFQNAREEWPLASEKGALKIRVVEYVPGEPKKLQTENGRDEELFAQVKTQLIEELAENKAAEIIAGLIDKLRTDETDPRITEKTVTHISELNSPALNELPTLSIGDITPARRTTQPETGFTAVKLLTINAPAQLDIDTKEVRELQRYATFAARSNMPYAPEMLPQYGGMMIMGTRAFNYIYENFQNGVFTYNPIYHDPNDDSDHAGHDHD